MLELLQAEWFVWGIGLIIGFQVLVVLLGELIYRGEKGQLPLTGVFRASRNAVLPLLVVYLFQLHILELDSSSTPVRVVATAFWISVVYAALQLLKVIVFEQAEEDSWRHRAPSLFQDLMSLLLIAIGAAVVLSAVWSQDLGAWIAALGVGSIVLGLALQETLGNLMAGIALLFERPFSIGDWIRVGDEYGEVEEINWRSVHLRTREQNLLVFPNSVLGREAIVNYARPTSVRILRLSTSFGLDAAPTQVKRVLEEIARQMPSVEDDPVSHTYVREVLDDRIRYESFLHVDSTQNVPAVRDDFYHRVWYQARRHGMPLPMPIAVEIKRQDAAPDAQWPQIKADLQAGEGFSMLSQDELETLAKGSRYLTYGAGEVVINAGEMSESVYVIASGELAADWDHRGTISSIAMGPGSVIGITSLGRGEASATKIYALEDTQLIWLAPDAVTDLLRSNTRLAVEFSKIWERRANTLNRRRLETRAALSPPPRDGSDTHHETSE